MANKPDFDNIVFEDRNKEYGAFHLRKFYKNSVLIGFLIAAVVFTLALSAPLAYSKFFGEEEEESNYYDKGIEVTLEKAPEPPPEEIKIPIKIPEVATKRNLELEIKEDEKIKKNEPPPTDEEMKDKQSGKDDKDGDKVPQTPITPPVQEPKPESVKIETWAPEMPEFPGGPSELLKFYSNHLEYTSKAEEENIQGTVRVSFVVNVDGSLTEVKIVSGLGYGLDEEVMKVFKKMPKWKPAKKGGKIVPLRMVTPIVFTLEDE